MTACPAVGLLYESIVGDSSKVVLHVNGTPKYILWYCNGCMFQIKQPLLSISVTRVLVGMVRSSHWITRNNSAEEIYTLSRPENFAERDFVANLSGTPSLP